MPAEISVPDERFASIAATMGALPLTPVRDLVVEDQIVYLDGRAFERVTFLRCDIRVAIGSFSLGAGCSISDSTFTFEPPARAIQDLIGATLSGSPRRSDA